MDVTIVIPTKNGGELFNKVLDAIENQKTEYSYEVICVDSGSTDQTKEYVKKHNYSLYEIAPEEFGHGKTRNFGASKGTGEFIIFITQDALPVNDMWLQNFITAMKQDKEIAGGFGRHLPYPDCNLLDKRDITAHFDGFGKENTVVTLADKPRYLVDEGYRHFLAFYSDNNSCMRRDIWEKYPYDDVDFAEDQIWARKMIERGYKKLYCNDAMVYHSHNYSLKSYYGRYYDEYKSLYVLHGYRMTRTLKEMRREMVRQILRDVAHIVRNYPVKKWLYWSYYAFRRDRYRYKAGYLAGMYHLLPESVQEYLDRHKSQQYKQIHGNRKRTDKSKLDKEFWKWVFLNPDLYASKPDPQSSVDVKLDDSTFDSRNDVCGFYNFVMKGEKTPFSKEDYLAYKEDAITVNWVIPEMGPGSGGHINIFRFVTNLYRMGLRHRIYIMDPVRLTTDQMARDFMEKYFDFHYPDIEIHVNAWEMKFAHATIATSWQTAYCVRDFDNTISKFYFVQDFEPYFYAMGSEYVFAENTYKLGFRGITAGDWLKDKLHEEYGMQTDSFGFSYDNEIYKPVEKRDDVKRVFFYARPVTPRRDFELGLMALTKLAEYIPDVEVVFAGWDVSQYKIDFNYQNLGIVDVAKLSDIYGQCDVCLVLSNTNLSLLPLEVMASNSVAMCSKGANSSWLVNEENSIMVDFDPDVIAETLAYYLNHPHELATIREKGKVFANATSWEQEAKKVKAAIEKGVYEDEKNISAGR
ncbi:MAG: glycosyltransferase [Eubacteriales bacterium]|nr:glycosyltransferase [Eubacteriales bacterium]